MLIGALRQRLDVQKKTIVGSTNQSAYEANEVWVNWKSNVPCKVDVRRGAEHYFQTSDTGAGQKFGKDVYFFAVRYQSVEGIDSTMRLKHAGLVFDIRTIRPDNQYRREMVIEAEVTDAVIGPASLAASIEEVIQQGWVGEEYSGFTVLASGGTAPYQFTTDSAGLAPGLALDLNTGIVSGTPTMDGTWPISIQVSDADGTIFNLPEFNIVINPSV
jgi:head-tail adaptor